jgi:hypothetical protein
LVRTTFFVEGVQERQFCMSMQYWPRDMVGDAGDHKSDGAGWPAFRLLLNLISERFADIELTNWSFSGIIQTDLRCMRMVYAAL